MPRNHRFVFAAVITLATITATNLASARLIVSTQISSALYDVDPLTGAASNSRPVTGSLSMIGLAVHPQTRELYGMDFSENAKLYKINPDTGVATALFQPNLGFIAEGDIAFDADGTLYFTSITQSFVGKLLYKMDVTTGQTTLVKNYGFDAVDDLSGFAWYNGQLLALDTRTNTTHTPQIYTIDRTTGDITNTVTLDLTFGIDNGSAAMAVDPETNQLYITFAQTKSLYKVNATTGVTTLVGPFNFTGSRQTPTGMAFLLVPEPSGLAILATGLIFAAGARRVRCRCH